MYELERRTEEIKLFGKDLILSERDASDVRAWELLLAKHKDNMTEQVVKFATMLVIRDGMKQNFKALKYYERKKRWWLRKHLKERYLLANLSNRQIENLFTRIRILEGWKPDTEPCKECGQQVPKKKEEPGSIG